MVPKGAFSGQQERRISRRSEAEIWMLLWMPLSTPPQLHLSLCTVHDATAHSFLPAGCDRCRAADTSYTDNRSEERMPALQLIVYGPTPDWVVTEEIMFAAFEEIEKQREIRKSISCRGHRYVAYTVTRMLAFLKPRPRSQPTLLQFFTRMEKIWLVKSVEIFMESGTGTNIL